MAITERIDLDFGDARRQLERLESQLDQLRQPIRVPVNITGDEAVDRMRRDFRGADDAVEDLNRELGQTERELRQVDQAADRSSDAMLRVGTRGVSAFSNLRGSIIGVAAAFAAVQGARAFLDFAGQAVSAASDLEESTSKAQVVFGEFADEIGAFARTGPQALGLANAAALEFTGTFGNLFVALGLSQEAAADLAPDIVQLGADLASFNNIEVTDALDKLRAGLVGEAEPLRVLGVNLTAATTNAKAMELGLVDATGVVSEAAKVQARYQLILEQTTTAQGDFARTSEGIANRQRTLNAEFENFRAEVGEALLPAFEALLTVAPAVIDALGELVPEIERLAASFAGNTESMVEFVVILGDILRVLPGVLGGIGDIGGFLSGIGGGIQEVIEGDFAGAMDEWTAAGERFTSLVIDEKVDKLRTGLINLLRDGVDPLEALNRQLVGLSDIDLDLEQLQALTTQFAQIAGVDSQGLFALSQEILQFGTNAGLSAEEIQVMREALSGLIAEREKFSRRAPGAGRSTFEDDAIAALTEADALEQLEAAAQTLDTTVIDLLNDQSQLPEEFQGVAGVVSEATIAYLNQVDAINELESVTGALPGTVEAAAEAMRTAEGEIVADVDVFLDRLRTTVAEQQEFDLGLAILRAIGLDDLAAQFEALGAEALDLVNDALANPAKAREAEHLIDGQYTGVSEKITADIVEGLDGRLINEALVQELIDAAEQANTPEVQKALAALALEYSKQLRIKPTIDLSDFGGGVLEGTGGPNFNPPGPPPRRDGGGGVLQGTGGVEVTIINPTTQDLKTDAAHAASTISAVTRLGGQ